MKKKLIMVVGLLLLVTLMVIGGTMAWFWDSEETDNRFTAGTVAIEINEHGFKDIEKWNPGDTTTKQVSVKSLGNKKSYIRVSLTPVWLVGEGEDALPINNVILNLATNNDWVKSGDWYYYKHIIEEEETSLLLQSVKLDGALTDNKYQDKTLKINVKAEAVQASNSAYIDVWDIDELPAEVETFEPTP